MNNDMFNKGFADFSMRFENPGAEFRGKPFWSWNGELEKEELLRQVDVLKEMGFGGYFMHSRAGLITEYLGEEWFKLINAVADYGEKVGMESWLYDEDRWPSGSAGGIVTRDPAYRMKSMYVFEMSPDKFVWDDSVFSAFAAKIDGYNMLSYEPITKDTDFSSERLKDMRVLKFEIVPDSPNSVYNGTTYIDTMMTAATEKFIEITHEEYRKRCGDRLGRSIKGIFTDEPHRGKLLDNRHVDADGTVSCGICYTDDIFEEIEKRYGYDMRGMLPELFYKFDGEMTAKIKHDYIDVADNLFVERFAKPINDWCKKNNIEFTGHVLHENSLVNQTVPHGSLMRFYEHMGVPGIDLLTEWDNSYWVAKQISSVARQSGQKWILSELYGCTGWQFNFRSHKAVGDWQALFGINVRCPHLSWYTMEGESKRDYPASILHQSAWYKDYNYVETYFARFGEVMAEGRPVCEVLVLNPIESAWIQCYAGWANWIVNASPETAVLEEHYSRLFGYLSGRHIDFDYGEEFLMAEQGSAAVENGVPVIRVGEMSYKVFVVSGALTLRSSTVELLERFASLGGRIVVSGKAPEMIDEKNSDRFAALCKKYQENIKHVDFTADALEEAIKPELGVTVDITAGDGGADALFCQLRECPEDGAAVVAVINTDRDKPRENVKIKVSGIGLFEQVQEWRLVSGKRIDVTGDSVINRDGCIVLNTDFEPCGERVFVLVRERDRSAKVCDTSKPLKLREGVITGMLGYSLDESNAMVLDYVGSRFNGRMLSVNDEVLKADMKIRDAVGIEHRSGGMLQPWYAKKYADSEYGELELEYVFYIDVMPKSAVTLAGERPELIEYYINGKKLETDGGFWIDSCFKTMPVPAEALRVGKNVITAKTCFRRTTNVESVYLLGEFGVRMDKKEQNITRRLGDRGRFFGNEKHIVALPVKIGFENLAEYDLPFYTGGVTYRLTPDMLPAVDKGAGERLFIIVDDFAGALVKVSCGGKEQILAWEPYEAEITDCIDRGVSVTLVCTRKNTFGPLHLVPAITGAVGPEHFTTGGDSFSDDYVLIDSGIFGGIKYEIRR